MDGGRDGWGGAETVSEEGGMDGCRGKVCLLHPMWSVMLFSIASLYQSHEVSL